VDYRVDYYNIQHDGYIGQKTVEDKINKDGPTKVFNCRDIRITTWVVHYICSIFRREWALILKLFLEMEFPLIPWITFLTKAIILRQ